MDLMPHFRGVLDIYEDLKANGGQLDTPCFNALIKAHGQNRSDWETLKSILVTMNAEGVGPNRETLQVTLGALGCLPDKSKAPEWALATVAEFNSIGIRPTLGAYKELMSIFNDTKCFSASFMKNTFEHVHLKLFSCYPDFLFHYDVKLVAKKK